MATWVTHLMIADGVLKHFPSLDRRGFCVGNIAPDCNVENEDWTAFTPAREVTHWMQGERKKASDCDAFCEKYILNPMNEIKSPEEYAFLLGYYAHLITDAAFQAMIRNEDRVKAVWDRVREDAELSRASAGMEETWDTIKKLIPKAKRMKEIYALEAEYLKDHPQSGYLTEIVPLKNFPDYIDYLPAGAVVRKIGVMGYLPRMDEAVTKFISISREEYDAFVSKTIALVVEQFIKKHLLQNPQELNQMRNQIIRDTMGKTVHIIVDRPIGYRHGEIVYPINYGYIPGIIAGDGEEQDAYILGVNEPLTEFDGQVIAAIRRKNDCEDKLVVAPYGTVCHQGQIAEKVYFQEQYFDSFIESLLQKSCGVIPYRWNGAKKEYLILLQTNNCWSFPKGHMEAGETETQTALRELFEETGLTAHLIPGKRVVSAYDIPPFTRKQVVLFFGEVCGDVTPQEAEIVRYKWAAAEELPNYLHKDTYAVCRDLL